MPSYAAGAASANCSARSLVTLTRPPARRRSA